MSATPDQTNAVGAEDHMRARLYDFLSLMLSAPPDRGLLQQCAALTGDDTALGQAVSKLAHTAGSLEPDAVEEEFNALFVGLGRGELLPYASYYLTGFLNEKPLATLRADMAAHAMTRATTVFEPEDNIASLMEMMGGLIVGRFGQPTGLAEQSAFFTRHLAPWAELFFTDLEAAENAVFYASLGTVGRKFMEIEREAFRMLGKVV